MKINNFLALVLLGTLFLGCSAVKTNTEFYNPLLSDLKRSDFELAEKRMIDAEINEEYSEKEIVLFYLDKGMVLHYAGKYEESNKYFELAEDKIDELFTKSITRGAASILLNDNVLAYSGEVYENIYLNVFKCLNYINMGKLESAYVEIKKVNDKLQEYEIYYQEEVDKYNSDKENSLKIEAPNFSYFNNALAHYLSYIIFRYENEKDNARISSEKLIKAWSEYPEVYNNKFPNTISNSDSLKNPKLNIIAFSGTAPIKEPVGARITTIKDFVLISDPTDFYVEPLYFEGITEGYNFKFEFPVLKSVYSNVNKIVVFSDSTELGSLELFENMENVAFKTFETNKSLTYFKTAARAILKGIGSASLGRTIKSEADGKILGDIAAALLNIVVDISENSDLRCWRTMPALSYVGEFEINEGIHNIEVRFLDENNLILESQIFDAVEIKKDLNFLEAYYLN